jgi:hypothetical protein
VVAMVVMVAMVNKGGCVATVSSTQMQTVGGIVTGQSLLTHQHTIYPLLQQSHSSVVHSLH